MTVAGIIGRMNTSSERVLSQNRRRLWLLFLLSALVSSGVAGIINQVVWQRALKIYLAGSEAVSSMIVVFVFMLGLGLGSQLAGRRAARMRNPLQRLALVEVGLAVVNAVVCFLLALDLTESIYAFQRVVASVGVPLRVLYALTAILLLTGPCLLMGMTIPLATEGCQRQLHVRENRFLGSLFFLNTAGAVIGAFVSGFLILPVIGQQAGLQLAIGMNALAGLIVLPIALQLRPYPAVEDRPVEPVSKSIERPVRRRRLRAELVVGFCLGFFSLAYEMYLFRVASLVYEPLPVIFSLVLALFLLTWSIGVGAARWLPNWIPLWLVLTGISIACVPELYRLARAARPLVTEEAPYPGAMIAFLFSLTPCVLFGVLFTQVVARFAKSWGADVGRYFAFNTFGSCAGILAGTLIGLEFAPEITAWGLASGVVVVWLATIGVWRRGTGGESTESGRFLVPGFAAGLFVVLLAVQLVAWDRRGRTMESKTIRAAYYGRGGVILIDEHYNMEWDGLWHSALSRNDNHVGSANWGLAVLPLICRPAERAPDVCVVGLGTGITTGTLARSDVVDRVDTYEINEELKHVLADYPAGTLEVATHPKVVIFWRDGRSGLALNHRKYDLISQQPLYLKQAGSSILLSKEYMQLVKSRLKPGGVFAIYCNSRAGGNEEQARIVRQTAREVFRYGETFWSGYMLLVSDRPIRFDRPLIERRLAQETKLRRECESYGIDELLSSLDRDRLSWESPFIVTDDHPIVEYPSVAKRLVRQAEAATNAD